MARPPLIPEDRRTVRIQVRVTVAEWARMTLAAAKSGISIPELLRRGGLRKRVLPKRTEVDLYLVSILHGLANNLNQMTHHANAGRGLPETGALEGLLAEVRGILNSLYGSRDQ